MGLGEGVDYGGKTHLDDPFLSIKAKEQLSNRNLIDLAVSEIS